MTLWNRGYARASLVGRERTMNPTAAAYSVIAKAVGKKRAARAVRKTKRRRKSFHRGNPAPAAIGILGGLIKGKLGQRIFGSERYQGGPLVSTVQQFLERIKGGDLAAVQQLHREATNVSGKHRQQWAMVWNNELPALGGALKPKVRAEIKRLDPTSPVASGGAERASAGIPEGVILGAAAPTIIRELTKPAPRGRVQYENYIDPVTGVLKRRRKAASRATTVQRAAVTRSGKLPQSALKAGVVIGGLAAGYYIGSKLNNYLAGYALSKEQAGAQAALAFREARAEAQAAKGAPLTAAEVRSMGDVYKQQLIALGYNPTTFTRKRSALESFFTGQEE